MKLKLLLIAVLLLSGCSAKFGYNNLDWLVHWFVDDYIDFEGQQKKQFDEKMAVFLDWHRNNELSQYSAHLREMQQQLLAGNVDAEQWAGHLSQLRQHWWRSRDKAAEIMLPLASTLSDAQVEALFDALREKNDERREERAEMSESEQREDRLEDLIEEFETWAGRLSDEQVVMLESFVDSYNSTFTLRMAYRDRIQQAARELMRQRNVLPDFETRLMEMIKNPEQYQGELTAARETNRQQFAVLMAEFTSSMTSYQRDYMVGELQDYIDDFDELAAGSEPYRVVTPPSINAPSRN